MPAKRLTAALAAATPTPPAAGSRWLAFATRWNRPSQRTVEQFAAARRVKDNACIHCHEVLDFEHERLSQLGQWRREDLWLYPLPENIGLTLDIDQGNRILRVDADSAAAACGSRAGDVLRQVNR